MAQYTELNIDQGTDFTFTLDLTNTDGSATNCAGYVFASSIRKSYYSSRPTANLTVTVVDASNGTISFGLTSSQTANIKAGRYLFDVKQTDDAGKKSRLFEGVATVYPQVTK